MHNFVLLGKATVNLLKCTLFSLLIRPNAHSHTHTARRHDLRKARFSMEKLIRICLVSHPYLVVFQAKASDFWAIVIGWLRQTRMKKLNRSCCILYDFKKKIITKKRKAYSPLKAYGARGVLDKSGDCRNVWDAAQRRESYTLWWGSLHRPTRHTDPYTRKERRDFKCTPRNSIYSVDIST